MPRLMEAEFQAADTREEACCFEGKPGSILRSVGGARATEKRSEVVHDESLALLFIWPV